MRGVRSLTSEQERMGNLRMVKPNGKRRKQNWNERCLGERPSTIKDRQPHCSHRAGGMLILKKKKRVMICRFQSDQWKHMLIYFSHPRPNLISALPLCTSASVLTVISSPWMPPFSLPTDHPNPHISSLTWMSRSDTPHSRLLSTVLPPLSSASDPQMLPIYNSQDTEAT